MRFTELFLCAIVIFIYSNILNAQVSYRLSVEQSIIQNKLEISVFLENTGDPFILGTSVLRLNVGTSGLDLTNVPLEIEEGQWDNTVDAANYNDQFAGRNEANAWISINIDYAVSFDGPVTPSDPTLIGKISIPIIDPSENSGISWRLSDINSNTVIFDADFDDITSNGQFINPQSTPLPIEISTFTSSVKGRDIFLNWITVTEINTSHFEVERKTGSDTEWKTIASVKAHGNTNSPREYSFADKKLNSGLYNYRLKLLDNNGSYSYSETVFAEVELPDHFVLNQNYPNPFNPFTTIDFQIPITGKVKLNIYNSIGEKINVLQDRILQAGTYSLHWDGRDINGNEIPSGIYFYELIYFAEKLSKAVKKMIYLK